MHAVLRRLSGAARRGRRTRLWAGATALTALAVLGAVGTALGGAPAGPSVVSIKDVDTSTTSTATSSGTTSSTSHATTSTSTSAVTSTTTSSPAPPPPPPPPSPLDRLYGVLPPGYSATLCGPSDNPAPQALATVDCRELDGGPTSARFALFADTNALASQFQDGVNTAAAPQCPGSIDSPRSWNYEATPAFSAGSLVCGTRNNAPDLMWTKNDALLLADVQGPSLDTLYGWWLSL